MAAEGQDTRAMRVALGVLRLMMGWTFLWPFLDKTFGLGFATPSERAWVNGGSPTTGYLANSTTSLMPDVFQGMAGVALVDWLFMLGLLGVGVSLLLGAGVRAGAVSGAAMLLLMWLARDFWPTNNPFLTSHLIYAAIMAALFIGNAGRYIGIGRWWESTTIVQRWSWLR